MKHQMKRLAALILALAISMSVMCVDAFAAGDSNATATGVTWNATYRGSITDSNTIDYYKLTLTSSGRVTLTATTEKMSSINYTIRDTQGNTVWYAYGHADRTTGISNEVATLDLIKGTYYFTVAKHDRADEYNGDYLFTFAFQSANESIAETITSKYDSLGTAAKISLNKSYKGQLAIGDSVDFYQFVMPSAGKLQVNTTTELGRICYYIYDGNGVQVWSKTQYSNSTTGLNSVNDTVDLKKGTYYFVTGQWSVGLDPTGPYSFKLTTSAGQAAKLSTPQITAIENIAKGTSGIKMNWGKVSGATSYEVYRRKHGASSWTKIATVTSPTHTDTSVRWMTGTLYDYSVVAVSSSARSAVAPTKTILRMAAPAITGLTNSASKAIKATWSQNKSADGYQIWYQVGENASTRKIITVYGSGTLSRTISGLTKGNSYKVFVRSFKKVNGVYYYSAWSASRTVKVSK